MKPILKRKFWIYLLPLLLLNAEKKEDFNSPSLSSNLLKIPEIETVQIEYPQFSYHPLKELYSQKKYKGILSYFPKLDPSVQKSWTTRYVVALSHFRLRQYSKVVPLVDSILENINSTNLNESSKQGIHSKKTTDPQHLFQPSAIQDWLFYVLGTSHHFIGNLQKSNEAFRSFRKRITSEKNSDYSTLFLKALQMETQNYLALKQYSILLSEFSLLSLSIQKNARNLSSFRRISNEEIEQRIHYSMALAYQGLEKNELAKEFYEKAIGGKSVTYTRKSVEKLLSLSTERELSPETQVKLAQYLYQRPPKRVSKKIAKKRKIIWIKNHDYVRILSLLEPFERTQKNSKIALQSQILLAQSYTQLGKKEQAHSLYKGILQAKPRKENFIALQQKAEFLQALLLKQNDPQKAHTSFLKIIQNAKHIYLSPSCSEILKFPEWTNRLKIPFLRNHYIPKCLSANRFKEVDQILFHWISEKKYSELSLLFSNILSKPSSEIPSRYMAKILFWLGEVSLKEGKKSQAQKYFIQLFLSYKQYYYTYKAWERLETLLSEKELKTIQQQDRQIYHKFLNSKEFQEKFSHVVQNYNVQNDSNFLLKKALLFLELGEITEGYEVFLTFLASSKNDKKKNYRMSHSLVFSKLFYKMGLHAYSIRYADFLNHYLNRQTGRNDSIPGLERWRYPLYFQEEVFSWAKKKKVDPYLIFGLIREESRFFPSAISRSGAIGLMQLMPKTARSLLKQVGLSLKRDVYEPNLNIHLGVHYLSQLLNRAPVSRSLAGYNGGPTRIRRLYKQFEKELFNQEHFVELIPIDETRNYVKKVLRSYYNYKEIYENP